MLAGFIWSRAIQSIGTPPFQLGFRTLEGCRLWGISYWLVISGLGVILCRRFEEWGFLNFRHYGKLVARTLLRLGLVRPPLRWWILRRCGFCGLLRRRWFLFRTLCVLLSGLGVTCRCVWMRVSGQLARRLGLRSKCHQRKRKILSYLFGKDRRWLMACCRWGRGKALRGHRTSASHGVLLLLFAYSNPSTPHQVVYSFFMLS